MGSKRRNNREPICRYELERRASLDVLSVPMAVYTRYWLSVKIKELERYQRALRSQPAGEPIDEASLVFTSFSLRYLRLERDRIRSEGDNFVIEIKGEHLCLADQQQLQSKPERSEI